MPTVTVAICTRNRAHHLANALDALEAQEDRAFDIIVVDQSNADDAELARRAATDPRLTIRRDSGRGLSRARNHALGAVATEWIAFVDDDCSLAPSWASELKQVVGKHPDVVYVTGHVEMSHAPRADGVGAAARPVLEQRIIRGFRVRPQELGFGVCFAVRVDQARALGGWDERLGAGAPIFPAAEDMDFNYRLLVAGHAAVANPRMRAIHTHWRTGAEEVDLYRGYARSWSGFSMKHFRTGDRAGGAWLWGLGVQSCGRMLVSSIRHRSRHRLRVAAAQMAGLVTGTLRGLTSQWS